jgi:hypothetical protein
MDFLLYLINHFRYFLEVLMGEGNNNSMDKYSGWERNVVKNKEGGKCTKEAY